MKCGPVIDQYKNSITYPHNCNLPHTGHNMVWDAILIGLLLAMGCALLYWGFQNHKRPPA